MAEGPTRPSDGLLQLRARPKGATVSVPLAELAAIGTDLRHVAVPFMPYTDGTAQWDLAELSRQLG